MISYSPKFSFIKEDWQKIGKGLLIQLLAVVVTYLTSLSASVELDSATLAIVSVLAVVVNVVYKFLRDTQYK